MRAQKNPAMESADFAELRWIESMLGHSGEGQVGRQYDVRGEIAASGA